MRLKKFIPIMLLIMLITPMFTNISQAVDIRAEAEVAQGLTGWHYRQICAKNDEISNLAKEIYRALYDMYDSKKLENGETIDLVNTYISEEAAIKYQKGNTTLVSAMNAARYAFYADFPEIFFVDFPKINLRITKDTAGNYHANLGAGSNLNYFHEGFTLEETTLLKENIGTAIDKFNAKLDEIVAEKTERNDMTDEEYAKALIKYAHEKVVKTTNYRTELNAYETDSLTGGIIPEKDNRVYVNTPYGALVRGNSLCEGYARAFKTILDRIKKTDEAKNLDMDCILVQGMHQNEGEVAVEHMWNYVRIGEEWYAVDATLDDPFIYAMDQKKEYTIIVDGFENTRYLLVGNRTMCMEHTPIGIVQAAGGYEFIYPELVDNDEGIINTSIATQDGKNLNIEYNQNGITSTDPITNEQVTGGAYYVNYGGKGISALRDTDDPIPGNSANDGENARYILIKYKTYKASKAGTDEEWEESNWGYITPELYPSMEDREEYTCIPIYSSEYIKFAVTTRKPGHYANGGNASLWYPEEEEEQEKIIAQTEWLYNDNGSYRSRPYVLRQTPPQNKAYTIQNNYSIPITATFTDDLKLTNMANSKEQNGAFKYDNWEEIKELVKITANKPTATENATVTSYEWDGKRNVTITLKVSEMYADSQANYSVYLNNLVGVDSGKVPNPISIGVGKPSGCTKCMLATGSWEFFGTPTLLENEDLSKKDWTVSRDVVTTNSEGENTIETKTEEVSNLVSAKIALVTTKAQGEEQEKMMEKLEDGLLSEKNVLSSETYNIDLNICRTPAIPKGHKLKLSVGFPAGYGPDDEGVTFEAYHFKSDGTVEKIPCVVTRLGLVIVCDSFSPFAIVAVEGNESKERNAVLTSTIGGKITDGSNSNESANIVSLALNESKSIKVEPDEGYIVESLTIGGQTVEIDRAGGNITITNGAIARNAGSVDISEENVIINANFVPEEIVEEEIAKGQTPVTVEIEPGTVTITKNEETVGAGQKLTIVPTINSEIPEENRTYQWFKDGKSLGDIGKNATLTISKASKEDAGIYTLKMTVNAGELSETVESVGACTVSIASFDAELTLDKEEVTAGDTVTATLNVKNSQNIDNDLVAIGGYIKFNPAVFENPNLVGQNGWDIDVNSINTNNFKFIIDRTRNEDGSPLVNDGEVLKITLKVKDLASTQEALIKIEGLEGSNAYVPDLQTMRGTKIEANDAEKTVKIKARNINITSSVYTIENGYISGITVGTTKAEFINNITPKEGLIFDNLKDENIIKTGTTVTIGANTYTLIVTGDINGDGVVDVTDVSQMQSHYLETEALEGLSLKAADLNNDGEGGDITDVSMLQQIYLLIDNRKTN
ncbi:MAG: hypothetical protein HFJ50_05230 [Clostridia bacterium]|jgi:hypothetical protein|nr:hypothetical protein [Clostridia bacterium]